MWRADRRIASAPSLHSIRLRPIDPSHPQTRNISTNWWQQESVNIHMPYPHPPPPNSFSLRTSLWSRFSDFLCKSFRLSLLIPFFLRSLPLLISFIPDPLLFLMSAFSYQNILWNFPQLSWSPPSSVQAYSLADYCDGLVNSFPQL